MKVSVFFDGQNFYRSLQRFDESLRVDYDRLAAWITQAVGGPGPILPARPFGACPAGRLDYEYTTEKRVDTRLVAEMIHYAAIGAFDAAVLVSGDDDFVPAVEGVNAPGRPG